MTTEAAPLSAPCGDSRHELCIGTTQDGAGRFVFCGCTTSGCACPQQETLRAPRGHNHGRTS